MFLRAIFVATAAAAALAFTAPAQADPFGVGFFIGSGPSNWVPKCVAPQVLTEVKDRAGRIHFVCMQRDSNVMSAPAYQAALEQRRQPADKKQWPPSPMRINKPVRPCCEQES